MIRRILFIVLFLLWLPSAALSAQSFSFDNPLVDATDRGDEQAVIALIKKGNSVNTPGKFGTTPLMRAAFRGNARLVQLLIKMGANINAQDIGGATALHLATRQGENEVVALLLQNNANIDATDNEGWTPLMRATIGKRHRVMQTLLNNKADAHKTNALGESAIVNAAQSGDKQSVQILLDHGVVTGLTPDVEMAMAVATQKDFDGVADMLEKAATPPAPPPSNDIASPGMSFIPPATIDGQPKTKAEEAAEDIMSSIPATPNTDLALSAPVQEGSPIPPAPVKASATPATPAPAPSRMERLFFIQVGSHGSETQARDAWKTMQKRYAQILGGLTLHIDKAVVNNKTVYRTRAGGFKDKAQASRLCSALWKQKVDCFVVAASVETPSTATPTTTVAENTPTLPSIQNVDSIDYTEQHYPSQYPTSTRRAQDEEVLPWLAPSPTTTPSRQPTLYLGANGLEELPAPTPVEDESRLEKWAGNVKRGITDNALTRMFKKDDAPAPQGKVDVGEAVRVNPAKPGMIPVLPLNEELVVKPRVVFWAHIGLFASEPSAAQFADAISRKSAVQGMRLRMIKMDNVPAGKANIAIQLGPFVDPAKAELLCKSDFTEYRCNVIRDVN